MISVNKVLVKRAFSRCTLGSGGLYIIDLTQVRENSRILSLEAKNHGVSLTVAFKAIPGPEVFRVVCEYCDKVDVSNAQELLAARSFYPECSVNLNDPSGIFVDDCRLLSSKDSLTLNCLSDLELFEAGSIDFEGPVGVRIRSTDILGDYQGGRASRFGFAMDDAERIRRAFSKAGAEIAHLHCHHGSESVTVAEYRTLWRELRALSTTLDHPGASVNIGGGQEYACKGDPRGLREVLEGIGEGRFEIEPGSLWCVGSVFFAATILRVEERSGITAVMIDASPVAALQWTTGDVYIVNPDSIPCISGLVTLEGVTCFEGDAIGEFPLKSGTLLEGSSRPQSNLILGNVSPYSPSRSFSFNGVEKPDVKYF